MKMTKLKIGSIEDDKPVSLTVKLPAMVYRDLTAYAEILGGVSIGLGKPTTVHRTFARLRRSRFEPEGGAIKVNHHH
jgi:hypothetical protein